MIHKELRLPHNLQGRDARLGSQAPSPQPHSTLVILITTPLHQSNRLQRARTLVTHCRLALAPVYLFSLCRFALILFVHQPPSINHTVSAHLLVPSHVSTCMAAKPLATPAPPAAATAFVTVAGAWPAPPTTVQCQITAPSL